VHNNNNSVFVFILRASSQLSRDTPLDKRRDTSHNLCSF
jgi:hypothetical protein